MSVSARHHTGRWLPSATGVIGVAALGYLAAFDPAHRGVPVSCPLHAATGWWCPGCGLTRATHHLLQGDVTGALSRHLLAPMVLVVGLWAWFAWWWPSVGGRPVAGLARVPPSVWCALGTGWVAFAVLRNLAPFSALAP
jgi:Protein of unknown function (DUF2752)